MDLDNPKSYSSRFMKTLDGRGSALELLRLHDDLFNAAHEMASSAGEPIDTESLDRKASCVLLALVQGGVG